MQTTIDSLPASGAYERASVSTRSFVVRRPPVHLLAWAWAGALLCILLLAQRVAAQDAILVHETIPLPDSTNEVFGRHTAVLPNGNVVISDPYFDLDDTPNVGAVYLYDGATLEPGGAAPRLISRLTGSSAEDMIGAVAITVLVNGNFVVSSPYWSNGSAANAGAATWMNGETGLNGAVSAANSLVGVHAYDYVGGSGVFALSNGNYIVGSPSWDDGNNADVGAVTWASGSTGIVGFVAPTNSLIGSTPGDQIGYILRNEVGNGNVVVVAPYWDDAAQGVTNAGATTWINGAAGLVGVVSEINSLVGSHPGDTMGIITVLVNGNYVVTNPLWNEGRGATTWANGNAGIAGRIDATNSLVGSNANDLVGINRVIALTNGNYVVSSPYWANGGLVAAGAATWGDGAKGVAGEISPSNSLVGSSAYDIVGYGQVAALANGNYVVGSPEWSRDGVRLLGAATWGDGTKGVSGAISAANSLIGSRSLDSVGSSILALTNGNYSVISPSWSSPGAHHVGAVTWANGATGITGEVTTGNSLVGSVQLDRVGMGGSVALTNGNYVVLSNHWDNDAAENSGALTWLDGSKSTTGIVTSSNSLVDIFSAGAIAGASIYALENGNYVLVNPGWSRADGARVGAVTWGNGTGGDAGAISQANSLVGSTDMDFEGARLFELTDGNYLVAAPLWDNGDAADVGAVSWASGTGRTSGVLPTATSVFGAKASERFGIVDAKALSHGAYAVANQLWSDTQSGAKGAVTWIIDPNRQGGIVSEKNSILGITDAGGYGVEFKVNEVHRYIVIHSVIGNHVIVASWRWALTLATDGSGHGTVTSLPASTTIAHRAPVTITATASPDSLFVSWSGDCAGDDTICVLTATRALSATATFTLKSYGLTATTAGSGSGTITGLPANLEAIAHGTSLSLTALPNERSTFGGWSGVCNGTVNPCAFSMIGNAAVTARFEIKTVSVEIEQNVSGGSIQVEVVPAEANVLPAAGNQSEALYPLGVTLRLTAVPQSGHSFDGWSSDLSGKENPATVVVERPLRIGAIFAPIEIEVGWSLWLPAISR